MSILRDIEKITEENFLFVLFDSFFLISPGVLTIFYFRSDILSDLDSIKIILLSVAVSLPFILWNFLMIFSLIYRGKLLDVGEKKLTFFILTSALALTSFIIYLLLFISYLFVISFKISLFLFLGLEFSLTILTLLVNKRMLAKINRPDSQPIDYIPNV